MPHDPVPEVASPGQLPGHGGHRPSLLVDEAHDATGDGVGGHQPLPSALDAEGPHPGGSGPGLLCGAHRLGPHRPTPEEGPVSGTLVRHDHPLAPGPHGPLRIPHPDHHPPGRAGGPFLVPPGDRGHLPDGAGHPPVGLPEAEGVREGRARERERGRGRGREERGEWGTEAQEGPSSSSRAIFTSFRRFPSRKRFSSSSFSSLRGGTGTGRWSASMATKVR